MGIGVENLGNEYIQNYRYQQSKTTNQSSVDFTNILSTKTVANTAKTEQSFEDMWKSRFPGAKYHVMDAYKISQGVWEREDFPFEKFFQDEVDNSVLEWQPVGKNPDMMDPQVQARLRSIRGQKSIVVPPELEEKMKNDPQLTKSVMARVESFIATDQAMTPNKVCSYLIVLDENGEIAHYRASSGGGFSGPTEEEQRQFLEERKEEAKKAAEYRELLKESALNRREKWQEINSEHYQKQMLNKAIESYENTIL